MSTKLHHGPRWGANFARLLHTTVCRVMACWLILTLPLYGLPLRAHASTSSMVPLPESFGLPLEEVGRVSRASELSGATAGLSSSGDVTAGLSATLEAENVGRV